MEVHKKSGTKGRLFEMMSRVNKVTLYESSLPKGTKIPIASVSSETIPVGENLPSSKEGDVSVLVNEPSVPNTWKEDFVSKFGDQGQLVKGLSLDRNFDVEGNPDYEEWKNSYVQNKLKGMESDSQKGFNNEEVDETFDVPKEKDQKYLDKSVDTENHLQVTKKDDGVRYPAVDDLKVDHESLEGLKGDDLPFNEALDGEEEEVADSALSGEMEGDQVSDMEPNEMEDEETSDNVPAYDDDMGGEESDGDQIEGGLADGAQPSNFDPEQLAMGLKIEMEHSDDPKIALEIAMDHLVEMPDYYSRLTDMEAEAENDVDGGEQALLDPSQHWVDDYVPKNVEEGNIDYPEVPDDAEAMGDSYEDEQQANHEMGQQLDQQKVVNNQIGQNIDKQKTMLNQQKAGGQA